MDAHALLELFDDLVADLSTALEALDDWGLSGAKPGQYVHDVVADGLLLPGLTRVGLGVLSEESGLIGPDDGSEPAITVVVDPIDGSTNASHGLPWFATSLCAVDADGPLAATVVNLATGEHFRAARGEGVDAEIDVVPSGVERLSDALIAFSGLPPEHAGWRQFRAYGAFALDLCAVATGSFDGCVDVDRAHGVWDYLGGALICVEAGVPVVDAAGEPLCVLDHGARRAPVAAATQPLLDELVTMRLRWGR